MTARPDRLLSAAEVCALLGGKIHRTTLWRQERKGEFPARVRMGRAIRWWESEILAHLQSLRRGMA